MPISASEARITVKFNTAEKIPNSTILMERAAKRVKRNPQKADPKFPKNRTNVSLAVAEKRSPFPQSTYFFIISIVASICVFSNKQGTCYNWIMKFLSRLVLIASILATIAFVFLFYLEAFNYDNYVFFHLHFDLRRFAFLPGALWGVWASFFLWQKKTKHMYTVLALIFCLVSIPSIIQNTGNVLARTHQMFLGKDYVVQKMEEKVFGSDLQFIKFINNYLSGYDKTTLVLPPNELPWRHTGNPQIMNSYLYPIETINSTKSASPYILISSEEDGASYHLWPDYKIPANQIIIYNWDSDKSTVINGRDWDPAEWQDKKPWGLIITKINE